MISKTKLKVVERKNILSKLDKSQNTKLTIISARGRKRKNNYSSFLA